MEGKLQRSVQLILVPWVMLFGFAAVIMRPASKAMASRLSWISWRFTSDMLKGLGLKLGVDGSFVGGL